MQSDLYKEALQATHKSTYFFFVITGISSFLYSSRTTIWVDYAQQFDDCSQSFISWILYIDSLLIGIVGVLFASLGDKIGFDKSISYKLIFITAGCIIESVANTFTVLCIGFLISQTATLYVSIAYVSWILPKKYARLQLNILYSVATAFYLLGPIFSGIVYKICKQYRYIFISNAILMCVLLINSVACLYGTQRRLEQQQIEVCHKQYGEESECEHFHFIRSEKSKHDLDEIFPSFMHNKEIDTNGASNSFWSALSPFEWYIILNRIIELGIVFGVEAIVVTFYVPFILNKYRVQRNKDDYILFCSMQILSMTAAFTAVTIFITKYTNVLVKVYQSVGRNATLIIIYTLTIVVIIPYLFDEVLMMNDVHSFWLLNIYLGSFIAVVTLILESLILDIQPPNHSGKINGIKALIKNIVRGILLLFVGLLWNITSNSLLYVTLCSCAIALLLNMSMAISKYILIQ